MTRKMLTLYGAGGVMVNDIIVSESVIPNAFGGAYIFNRDSAQKLSGKIIHIPIIKDHWGHFLIDVLCRFWFLVLPEYKDCIITCCVNLKTSRLTGNYLQVLRLLGVMDRLYIVTAPIRCDKILIPDCSFGFNRSWNSKYSAIIRLLLSRIKIEKKYAGKNIYFTRTRFLKSRIYEIGEKQIEKVFKDIGFEILSPELLSIEEQISCFQTAKEIVSLSGTIPHNIVFARDGLLFTILNRQPVINLPQLRINQMMKNVSVRYVDVYHPIMKNKPRPYGSGAVWVFVSDKFREFLYAVYGVRVKQPLKLQLLFQKIHWQAVSLFDYVRGIGK